jgi:hypothetical protein
MRFLGGLLLVLLPSLALANGRAPSTSTINFRRGNESQIAAGMTFGVVYSNDNGATWSWSCEDAVGYGGNYDPDYAWTQSGALFATTFDGLKVNRDSCTYQRSPLTQTEGPCIDNADPDTIANNCPTSGFTCAADGICEKLKFISSTALAPDGTIYVAASDPGDATIYKSTDDGMSFQPASSPGLPMDWWQSVEVAPTDSNRVYLTGYRLMGQNKTHLLFRSDNAGGLFSPMPTTGFSPLMSSSVVEIAGISKIAVGGAAARDIIYVIVRLSDNTLSDALYRSIDGGQNWQKLKEMPNTMSFVARASGELIIGTQAGGSFKAQETGTATLPVFTEVLPTIPCTEVPGVMVDDDGDPRTPPVLDPNMSNYTCATGQGCVKADKTECGTAQGQSCFCAVPHINCLGENTAGEVWACTQNYGSITALRDDFGIMKTTDFVTWTGMLKFQNLVAPQECAPGTVQKDKCDAQLWCGLCAQLGCDPGRDCTVAPDAGPADGAQPPKKPGNCGFCQGADLPGVLLLSLALCVVCLRRRRRV